MTNVLIVAKTIMGSRACIGALEYDTCQPVRVLAANGGNFVLETEFQVGQLWEMELAPEKQVQPPHVEDARLQQRRLLGVESNLYDFLIHKAVIWCGGWQALYDGKLHVTSGNSGYIAQRSGVPPHSTGFWLADLPLVHRLEKGNKSYYWYGDALKMSYVGVQNFAPTLPIGTLLRVSLARWWKPQDAANSEARCYLQLSGWYSAKES